MKDGSKEGGSHIKLIGPHQSFIVEIILWFDKLFLKIFQKLFKEGGATH